MQIVYISNRPDTLNDTLNRVAGRMPFVTSVVVCAPDSMTNSFKAPARLQLNLIAESSILSSAQQANIAETDHQRRNYLLRAALVEKAGLDQHFIMSDDDSRPLREIQITDFIQAEQYLGYYFHNLLQWRNSRTEFDAGQISSGALLCSLALPTYAFASHMPQIIDRDIFLEASLFFKPYRTRMPLCEWSTYFNYALHHHPEQFAAPRPYATLCWPEHPMAWTPSVLPEKFLFENYTPSLYEPNQVFFELNVQSKRHSDDKLEAALKIAQWQRYTIDTIYPEQAEGLRKYLTWRTWVNKLTNHQKRYPIHSKDRHPHQ